MGSNRVLTIDASPLAVSRVLETLQSAADLPARAYVAAFVRHIAHQRSAPLPHAFVDDPGVDELDEALRRLGNEQYDLSLIGSLWERLLGAQERQQKGSHFTPTATTATVASLAFTSCEHDDWAVAPSVWDPACGGGAFLLAAAEIIETRSTLSREAIVRELYATDIDPTALDVCRATLELWCGVGAELQYACCDALLDVPQDWPERFDVVLGNPPFLGQLAASTARSKGRRQLLNERYASAAGTYVDDAGLFVELATERVRAGGAVALILPESLLAARDARPMREVVSERATITHVWIGAKGTFTASVDVIALVLRGGRSDAAHTEVLTAPATPGPQPEVSSTPTPPPTSWGPLLAAGTSVPHIKLSRGASVLSNLVVVTAGFRQHFYGIATAVRDGEPSRSTPKLVTSGAIDALTPRWGERKVRFAKQSFERPVLHLAEIEDKAVQQWFNDRCKPKLLLASQTRVVEGIVDSDGWAVPSVPVISVEPANPDLLWHLAAILTSPAISAYLASHAAGTGLSRNAIRVRATAIGELPIPQYQSAWDDAAASAERAQLASEAGDRAAYVKALRSLADSMNAAYGVEDRVTPWWWDRMGLPPHERG